jgi:cytidylate kinase
MSNRPLRIAVSGKSGCGNTTVSTLLAQRLGIQVVNYTFRSLAQDENLSFAQICKEAENDPKWDLLVDQRQISKANLQPSVLASRLAIWLWKEAELRVWLEAPLEVRARRIHQREGGDLEQTLLEQTRQRDLRDHNRYLSLYGIDNDAERPADLSVDVSQLRPEQIVDLIVQAWKQKDEKSL